MFDVFISDDFNFKAEVDQHGQLVLHMEVFNWSAEILKRMRLIAEDGMEEFKNQGFTLAYCVTSNPRLVQMVYCGELRSTATHEGIIYQVIIWDFH